MTAVEWLQSGLELIMSHEEQMQAIGLFEQAKEMEKKIIAQAFEDGDYNYFYSKKTGKEFENGIEYYNEKFKQQ